VKVLNRGKLPAKNVEARVEKIELHESDRRTQIHYYHPTTVKWSGEPDWNPVNIGPESHFFLDVFWVKNERTPEVFSFNEWRIDGYGIFLESHHLTRILEEDIQPSGEIYWNVWVENPYNRGLPDRFLFEGHIIIFFVVNGENCGPVRFEAVIDWTSERWNQPDIEIRAHGNLIDHE
jgi:hypothetical protein